VYVKRSLLEAGLVPFGVVTVMSTIPFVAGGDLAVIDVAEFTVKVGAFVDPNFTAVAPLKLVPVMLTAVPPVARPLRGDTLLIIGGGGGGPVRT
jgi:hypothetical protein